MTTGGGQFELDVAELCDDTEKTCIPFQAPRLSQLTVLCYSKEIVAVVNVVDHNSNTPDIAMIALTAMILLACDRG